LIELYQTTFNPGELHSAAGALENNNITIMSIFSNLFGGKSNTDSPIPVLPTDIHDAAALELQDIIAPSAIEISSGFIKIGDKIAKTYFTMSYPKF
jgi:hypothetical protein